MRAPLATTAAILTGIVILAGYFIPYPPLQELRALLVGWGVILAGVAGLVGVINLVATHWRKANSRRDRDIYSLFLILAFIAVAALGLWLTPADPLFQRVVTSIQVPVETSLMAILAVSLAFTCLRLVQKRQSLMGVVFLLSAIVFLVVNSSVLASLQNLALVKMTMHVLEQIPLAGARGILLGVALGSLTAGLRILLGADRPYSG